MNEIKIYNSNELATTPEKCFSSVLIKKNSEVDIINELEKIIARTHLKTRINLEQDYLSIAKCELANFLKEKYDYLTIPEVEIAFNYGIRKAYKDKKGSTIEYYGLSIATFQMWIDLYVEQIRQTEINKRKPKEVMEIPQFSSAEIKEKNEKAIENAITELALAFGNFQVIPDGYNWVYDHLRKKGTIQQATGELRESILNKAIEIIKIQKLARNDRSKITDKEISVESKRLHLEWWINEQLKV